MTEYTYDFDVYAYCVGDRRRTRAYAEAIAQVVRPGSVVIDLGAGGGVLSVLAAKAGARRVYAIEGLPLGSVVVDSAKRSGVGEIVTFVQGLATELTLPELADVIVSDIRGVLPLYRGLVPSIVDARSRLLRTGGALVPLRDTLHAALVTAPAVYERHIAVYEGAPYGVDMRALRQMAVNRWYHGPRADVRVVSDVAHLATLEYGTMTDTALDARFNLTSAMDGVVHGFLLWFDSELAPGVAFSNHPQCEESVYGRGFFPFERPLDLRVGDRVTIRLRAALFGRDYTWTWDTDGVNIATPVRFRQSTFRGIAIR
jgi:protein arginine N-methyltransferase 1